MNPNCGIYKITNLVTGEFYIGQSVELVKRKISHFGALRANRHHNHKLQKEFNEYGGDNFTYEILLYCEPFELTRYEQYLVDKWKPYYNVCTVCVQNRLGAKSSDETRRKISKSNKGRRSPPMSEDGLKRMKEALSKRVISAETRAKISASQKGRQPSEYQIQRIKEAKTGSKHTEETKRKMSESHKGKSYYIATEETRRKMSESAKHKKKHNLTIEKETELNE